MFKSLVAGRSLPGWITLGWVVLGEIHQGRFALEVLGGITDFFQKHVFIGLLIGFGFLYVSSVWPKLKRYIPSWLRFETIHERVHTIESRLKPKEVKSPECYGVVFRRESKWVASLKSMLLESLTDTTIRIHFIKENGADITNPTGEWLVNQERGPDGDLIFTTRTNKVTLNYNETQHFELITINKNGSLSATLTQDLKPGDWKATISLVSAGRCPLEGTLHFTIYPDNDIEWKDRHLHAHLTQQQTMAQQTG